MNWNIYRSEVSGIQHGKTRHGKLKEKLKHRKWSEQSWIILEEKDLKKIRAEEGLKDLSCSRARKKKNIYIYI